MNLKQLLAGGGLLLAMGVSGVGFSHGKVCKPDIEKYCKEAQGHDAKMQCITQNKSKFSPECQAKIEKREKFRAACGADKKKYCGEDHEGQWKGKSCLRDHLKDLSSQCKTLLEENSKSKT